MKFNQEWTYREIYGYHILIYKRTDSIVQISPTVAKLFQMNDFSEKNISEWINNNALDIEKAYEAINLFKIKGILINE